MLDVALFGFTGDGSGMPHFGVQGLNDAPTSLDLVPECDPMPGWKVTWNPPDCSGGGNGYPGGWGPEGRPPVAWAHTEGAQEALAAPTLMSYGPQMDQASSAGKKVSANPGHLVLCGHAMAIGAASACASVLSGKAKVEDWNGSFQKESEAAASAMTPVGGLVLREHVFNKRG